MNGGIKTDDVVRLHGSSTAYRRFGEAPAIEAPNEPDPTYKKREPNTANENRKRQLADLSVVAPTFAELYGADDLDADEQRELVSLESLPPWPGARSYVHNPGTDGARELVVGHGLGPELDERIGGGVHPGMSIGIAAATAGAGKTALTMQIADGCALRCAELVETGYPGPLTPVMVVSEMGMPPLTWRTLARWTSINNRVFRAGKSAPRLLGWHPERVAAAFDEGRQALRGFLGKARRFQRLHRTDASGEKLCEKLAIAVDTWRDELAAEFPGRPIWPVVVLDPIQRWCDPAKSEVEGLNALVEALRERIVNDKWIALITSDTNKPMATGKTAEDARDPQQEGAAAFRGSYKLMHILDAAIYLRKPANGVQERGQQLPAEVLAAARHDQIEAVLVKVRFGHTSDPYPMFHWERHTGRFEPIARDTGSATAGVVKAVTTSLKSGRAEKNRAEHQANRDKVHKAIVENRGISTTRIADVAGMSVNTVRPIVQVFAEEKAIVRDRKANEGKGGWEWSE